MSNGHPNEVASAIYEAGAILASIEKYKFEQPGFFGIDLTIKNPFGNDTAAFMRDCLSKTIVRERLGRHLFELLSAFVAENRSCLNQVNEEACLVHGDFNANNILIRNKMGKWCVSAILDWEFAHAGTSLFDLGSMLRYQEKYPGLQAQFIEGFCRAGGMLPGNWKQMSRFIDLNNLLEFLTDSEEKPSVFDDVKQVIATTINNWEQLATNQ